MIGRNRFANLAYLVLILIGFPNESSAASFRACQEFARDVSGYNGAIPAEYNPSGGALQGALKGAAAGAAIGWMTDSDKKKAAKRGAVLGGLLGALKKADQNKKRKKNAEQRRRYQLAIEQCMQD